MTATTRSTTTSIRQVIDRPLDRKIEEIIKVNQDDLEIVRDEIAEYVATDHINAEYRELFEAIAEGPQRPSEQIGIWVSGFFGSGKSSFAKNLGYALRNPDLDGTKAAVLLGEQLGDPEIKRRIDFISHRFGTVVLMFDVTSEKSVRTNTERIAEIVYNVLLRELGYPEDWTLAELELELERDGTLDRFLALMAQEYGGADQPDPRAVWRRVTKGTQAWNRASAILAKLDPATYPAADTWADSMRGKEPRLDVNDVVMRLFELMGRRRPGQALAIIIDEVGQYVGRSGEKIEDLRAFVEQVGKESANRVKRKQFPAPVWVVVTSQERLDEVVSALDEGMELLPKLQDRFHYGVDLIPSDIREVATKRVLGKSADGDTALEHLFDEHGGRLQAYTEFERSSRRTDLTSESFSQFYPFLPHYIDLAIDIVTGLRARSSGFRQTGAANRTIIKLAHEMLVGEPRLADAPLGALVTLDRVYDLVRHSPAFDQNHKIEMDRVRQEFGEGSWEERVTKALALLELVKNLPRTDKNIAAVLYDRLGAESPLPHVQQALQALLGGQYVREAEDGWKLQTAEEKRWDQERRAIAPKPLERNEVIRETIGKAFAEADLRTFKLKGRSFRIGLTVQIGGTGTERKVEEGLLQIKLRVAEPDDLFDALKTAAQDETRDPKLKNLLPWAMALDGEIDDLARDVLRSRVMVNKYEALSAQGKLQSDEKTLLQDEKNLLRRLEVRLAELASRAMYRGSGFHAGNVYDGSDLGQTLGEAVKGYLGRSAEQIFPKLVTTPLKGNEAEELLKAANLNNVPVALLDEGLGLGLVVKREGRFVVNDQAQSVLDVARYLADQKDYGLSVTGKLATEHFEQPPFGWDQDTLRVILAALFRSGKITVTSNGRPFKTYTDAAARVPFANLPAFKSATFEWRDDAGVTYQDLARAATAYENLTGSMVDVDQEAIAAVFRRYAADRLQETDETEVRRRASGFPEDDEVVAYRSLLASVMEMDSGEAVKSLGTYEKTLRDGREAARRIRQTLDTHQAELVLARAALDQLWPLLSLRDPAAAEELRDKVEDLRMLLASAELYAAPLRGIETGKAITTRYQPLYEDRHAKRDAAYAEAIESIKTMPEWAALDTLDDAGDIREEVLGRLTSRDCGDPILASGEAICARCGASIGQLESETEAVDSVRQVAIAELRQRAMPSVTTVVVRVRDLGIGLIETEEDIADALARIKEQIRAELGPNRVVALE